MDADRIGSRLGFWITTALGVAWASPMSLAGVIAGLAMLPFGARLAFSDWALVFHRVPLGPGGALTLGNVILHTGGSLDETALTYACRASGGKDCVRLGDHERAHVYQYMLLGPFFLPLYFLCGGISARNRFEQAADRYAQSGSGWWPWWAGNAEA